MDDNEYEEMDDILDVTDDEVLDDTFMSTNTSILNKSKQKSKVRLGRLHKAKRMRIGSDSSNRSYQSQSHIAATGYKRKIRNLLQNNKSLARALEESNLIIAQQNKALSELDWQVNCKSFLSIKLNEVSQHLSEAVKCLSQAMQYSGQESNEPTVSQIDSQDTVEVDSMPHVQSSDNAYIVDFPRVARPHDKPSKATDMSMIAEVSICEEIKLPPILFEDDNACDVVERKVSSRSRRVNSRTSSTAAEIRVSARESRFSSKSQSSCRMSQTPKNKNMPVVLSETPKTPELVIVPSKWKSSIPKFTAIKNKTPTDKDNQHSVELHASNTKSQSSGVKNSSKTKTNTSSKLMSSTNNVSKEVGVLQNDVNIRRHTFVIPQSPKLNEETSLAPVSLKRLTYCIDAQETLQQPEIINEENENKLQGKRSCGESLTAGKKQKKSRVINGNKCMSLAKANCRDNVENRQSTSPLNKPEVDRISSHEANKPEDEKQLIQPLDTNNKTVVTPDIPNQTNYVCEDMSLTEMIPVVLLTDIFHNKSIEVPPILPTTPPTPPHCINSVADLQPKSNASPIKPTIIEGESALPTTKSTYRNIDDCSEDSDFEPHCSPVKKKKVFQKLKMTAKKKGKAISTIENLMKVTKKPTFISLATIAKVAGTNLTNNPDVIQSQLKVFDLTSCESAEDSVDHETIGKFVGKNLKSKMLTESKGNLLSNIKKRSRKISTLKGNDKKNEFLDDIIISSNENIDLNEKERESNIEKVNVKPNTNKLMKNKKSSVTKTYPRLEEVDNAAADDGMHKKTSLDVHVGSRLSRARKVINYNEESINMDELEKVISEKTHQSKIANKEVKHEPEKISVTVDIHTNNELGSNVVSNDIHTNSEHKKQINVVSVDMRKNKEHSKLPKNNMVLNDIHAQEHKKQVVSSIVSDNNVRNKDCKLLLNVETVPNSESESDFELRIKSPTKVNTKKAIRTNEVISQNLKSKLSENGVNAADPTSIDHDSMTAKKTEGAAENDRYSSSSHTEDDARSRRSARSTGRNRKAVSYKEPSCISKMRR